MCPSESRQVSASRTTCRLPRTAFSMLSVSWSKVCLNQSACSWEIVMGLSAFVLVAGRVGPGGGSGDAGSLCQGTQADVPAPVRAALPPPPPESSGHGVEPLPACSTSRLVVLQSTCTVPPSRGKLPSVNCPLPASSRDTVRRPFWAVHLTASPDFDASSHHPETLTVRL